MAQSIFPLVYLIVVILLMIYAIAGTLFQHKHFHFIHQTGLGIIIGWCIGGLIFLKYQGSRDILEFNQNIFFFALLPAIIFSGGYNLKKTGIFKNFNYISIYGIIGTLVAFFVILGLTIMINELDLIRQLSNIKQVVHLSTTTILFYSATICATDSVAALTMIKAQKYPKLFSIIFGEGMVNDAVAIILFRSVFDLFDGTHSQSIGFGAIMTIFKNFLLNLIFSLLIGIGTGLICTFVFKKLRFLTANPVIQVVLSYLFGIFSYALAQLFDFSGVIAVLVSAIVMAHFNFYNLSPTGQLSTGVTFQTISFFAESFLFVYLGMSFWNYVSTQNRSYSWSWTFVALQLVICTIARFASVFVLSGIFYLFMKKKWKVGLYQLGIIWFAGIIRGSVAFALILTVPNSSDPQEAKQIQIIKSSVLIIVFLTTIILGGIMPTYITCSLNRAVLRQQQQARNNEIEAQPTNQSQPLVQKPKKKNFFSRFDQQYFKPWFIYNYHERKDDIKKFKKLLKINSADFKGGQFIALMNTNAVAVQNQSTLIQDKKESLIVSEPTNEQRNTLM